MVFMHVFLSPENCYMNCPFLPQYASIIPRWDNVISKNIRMPGPAQENWGYNKKMRDSTHIKTGIGKIRLGISACLLGEKVRYDGRHKLDHFLSDTLGQYVEWFPVCPEVECGMPIPREVIRLAGDPENPGLVTEGTGNDHTARMKAWAAEKMIALEKEDLCGFVFKSRSPSCGVRGVKVYDDAGMLNGVGTGLFARAFMEHFPIMPVEDEERLHDPALCKNFIARIFALQRWKMFRSNE
jgi:uncharacterized protein YbbK (DUF523 family)